MSRIFPGVVRIEMGKITRFTLPDGSTCYGDSDGETIYDIEGGKVYFPLCPNCKKVVKPDDKVCKHCEAELPELLKEVKE